MKSCFRLTLFVFILLPTISFADYSYYQHLPSRVKRLQTISSHTSQDIFRFVNKRTENKRLISADMQKKYMKVFFKRFFYPWKPHMNYMTIDFLRRYVIREMKYYHRNLGYAANFHHHTAAWFAQITKNMNVPRFPNADKRAITIDNTYVRLFPTMTPHYTRIGEVGKGYPFDDFQLSVVWAGTPVRILQKSKDGAWEFVLTPAVSGWVQTNKLAIADQKFVLRWRTSKFAALIARKFSVTDAKSIYRFDAYMGSIFPYEKAAKKMFAINIPVKDVNDQARYVTAYVPGNIIQPMPWLPTAKHFAMAIHQLLGSHYGWGGVYFYGDCSSTLKSIFTPFGIWLPRNSQSQSYIAKRESLAKLDPMARKAAILKYGKPFTTLISIKGHIMLYVGEYKGEIMTFQNVWGFVTMSRTGKWGRDVLGSAVLLPLKLSFGKSAMFPQIDAADLAMTFLN